MDPRYQVGAFLCRFKSPQAFVSDAVTVFNVYTCGDPDYFLFEPLGKYGCLGGVHIPVRKSDLLPEYRERIERGEGNTI